AGVLELAGGLRGEVLVLLCDLRGPVLGTERPGDLLGELQPGGVGLAVDHGGGDLGELVVGGLVHGVRTEPVADDDVGLGAGQRLHAPLVGGLRPLGEEALVVGERGGAGGAGGDHRQVEAEQDRGGGDADRHHALRLGGDLALAVDVLDGAGLTAAARGPAAVEEFWRAVRRTGTPVVEAAGSPGERTATFLWRGGDELADVILVADRSADARSFERNRMTRVPGSDIWHLTYRMRADWRCSYAVAPVPADGAPPPAGPANEMARVRRARALSAADPADAPAIARWFDALAHSRPDPLARERLDGAWSVASLPDAPAERWRTAPGGAPQGRVDGHGLADAALGNTRTVRVYTPAAQPPQGGWPVAVLLDGEEWWSLPLAPLLDRLIAAGTLPPM